jgi:uncharacterized damage-inducible protein DinB
MAAPTRAEAIAILTAGNQAIHDLVARLTDAQLARPGAIGGGDWSAKDLLGHIAFWEELAIDAVDGWRAGRRPRAADIAGQAGVDQANAENQRSTADQSLAETRLRAAASHAALLDRLRAIDDQAWATPTGYDPKRADRTLADLLGGVTGAADGPFRHAFAHLADLEAYVASVD